MQENFRDRLWDVFWDEARARLDEMRNALATLAHGSCHENAAAVIGRGGHTLKGNAGAMGLHPVADLASRVERVATVVGASGQLPDGRCIATLGNAIEVLDAFAAARSCETNEGCASATAELDAWLGAYTG